MARVCIFLPILLLVLMACAASAEELPTCNCWTKECGFCRNPACAVKQDLSTSRHGITVTSKLKWRQYNNIVFYDEASKAIGKLRWSLRGIFLTGCMACQTPMAVRRARTKGGLTQWKFSVKNGLVEIAIKGNVVFSQKMAGECAEKYSKVASFAFNEMGCENTFTYHKNEMELGEKAVGCCQEDI